MTDDDRVLRLERRIAAPPEQLFEHFTEPELLVKWWGPEGYDVPEQAIDLRPGGHWSTTMRDPDGQPHRVSGVYRVIDPPRRLVFTWAWHDMSTGARNHETEVTITFEPAPGGTRLVLVQQAFESANASNLHGQGWNSSLNRLEKAVA